MSKKTGLILGIILTIVVGTYFYTKFCCECCSTDNGSNTSNTAIATTENGLVFKSSTLDFSCPDNFNFKENDANYVTPVSGCINDGIAKLKADLETNPNQKLKITGYCTSTEKNSSIFPNLGFARANQVKEYFVSNGIPSDKLEVNGEVKDMSVANGVYVGPISLEMSNADANASTEDWGKLKEEINANPLTVYFQSNQAEINLSDADREQVAKIVKYLDHDKTAKLDLTGYTDNTGNPAANVKLSKERADFVAAYFVKNGIAADRMVTSGKGPEDPIADNTTEEGKAKNRRTVVKIQ